MQSTVLAEFTFPESEVRKYAIEDKLLFVQKVKALFKIIEDPSVTLREKNSLVEQAFEMVRLNDHILSSSITFGITLVAKLESWRSPSCSDWEQGLARRWGPTLIPNWSAGCSGREKSYYLRPKRRVNYTQRSTEDDSKIKEEEDGDWTWYQ